MLLKGFENTPELGIELRNELETFRLFIESNLSDQDKLHILIKSIEICDEQMEYDYNEESKVDYFQDENFIYFLLVSNISSDLKFQIFHKLCKD
jgi:hypothetical protein